MGVIKVASPRVRSENVKTPPKFTPQPKILVNELIAQIARWKLDGDLTSDEVKVIIAELNKI